MIAGLVMTTVRLYRVQIAATAVLLTVFLAWLFLSFRTLHPLLDAYGEGNCSESNCAELLDQIDRGMSAVAAVVPYLGLVPAGIGAFWGVLAVGQEFEARTTKLALTQSVSRRSWILVRLGVLGFLLVIAGAASGVALNWWFGAVAGLPLARSVEAEVGFSNVRGLGVMGWWLLGFAVGAASGAFLRRVAPAVAVTTFTMVGLLLLRNLTLSSVGSEQATGSMTLAQAMETVGLIGLSLVVLGATCWWFERAKA